MEFHSIDDANADVYANPNELFLSIREEHTQRKIDKVIVDAKAKMAKGDKKGKKIQFIHTFLIILSHHEQRTMYNDIFIFADI